MYQRKDPMTSKEIVSNIYTVLEMLRLDREDLHAFYADVLYTDDGNVNLPAWNELTLHSIENDVIFRTPY